MPILCPRCSRQLSDSADPAEQPLFCMFCGQKLRTPSPDETLAPVVQPSPLNALLSFDPDPPPDDQEDQAVTRSIANDPSDPDPTEATNNAPSQVAGFRLLRYIGGGGMGNVYEAEAPATGQRVAVKLLSRRLSTNPASVERFRQEGRLASQISHPRCVFVMRADADNGRPFIVMELMPGRTLKDVVDDRGPLPVEEAVTRMLDVVDGLIEAHRLGVIHRDVKPSNCFLTADDRVKVGDFGLSKSLAGSTPDKQLTHSGTFLGTVLFAPPEQIRHEPVGYDSDVYAVSATLYYLLAGRAPHQHESLTAVLAKAISEPAPSLRPKRPDVPAELDRVVLKGLERDRTRRYQSLDELRDALLDQLPSQQRPATPRLMGLAYLIDSVALMPVAVPLELLYQYAVDRADLQLRVSDLGWAGWAVSVLYFTLAEGLYGTTLGKRLLRLRVVRLGEAGPPGLKWALVRTLVYNALWFALSLEIGILLAPVLGRVAAGLLVIPTFLVGLTLLLLQLRKTTHGYRGVHDFAAGTRTVRRVDPARRHRLVSRFPNPLDRLMKSAVPLPAGLGGFVITGKVCEIDDGGEVWVGEDKSLGRRVIVRVEPPGAGDDSVFDEPVVRPSRLRAVGHGTVSWGGGERAWVAYVAPAGSPLPDVVSPTAPLPWGCARGVLDDLVSELNDGSADGTVPRVLCVEQVWVEPGGRTQLLDFPLPTGQALQAGETKSRYPGGVFDPAKFVKQVTTLTLEGAVRTGSEPVRAPLSPPARRIADRVMADRYRDLTNLRDDLRENAAHPSEVSTGMRAGHLTVQGLLLAVGMAVMLFAGEGLSFVRAMGNALDWEQAEEHEPWIDTAEERSALIAQLRQNRPDPARAERSPNSNVRVWYVLSPEQREQAAEKLSDANLNETVASLRRLSERERNELDRYSQRLNKPEAALLGRILQRDEFDPFAELPSDEEKAVRLAVRLEAAATNDRLDAAAGGPATRQRIEDDRFRSVFNAFLIALFAWPLIVWPLFAVVFRGGLAYWFAGITLVRSNGRKAGRLRCGLRELLVWLPFTALMFASLILQHEWPALVTVRTFVWLLGATGLLLMVAVALRTPSRGPHDRLLDTHLVPG